MGAVTFAAVGEGDTAQQAFNQAVERARYQHGNNGYTGSIAEKTNFTIVSDKDLPYDQAMEIAKQAAETPAFDDKWGAAGAVKIGHRKWIFFGVAPE